ncbi:MAG: hypothetical protein AVDCRST_MAG73-3262, partial [uncultured Thermomicrobiales bacterium]
MFGFRPYAGFPLGLAMLIPGGSSAQEATPAIGDDSTA